MFIATQGPLNNTISKFFKLIMAKNIRLVVMLCRLEEDSRRKCECYWPTKVGCIRQFEDVEVYLEKEEYIINNALIKREIVIKYEGIEKRVTQLQMVSWPDHNVPDEDNGYVTIETIYSYINEYRFNCNFSPVLIHCRYIYLFIFSAGTGRSGTFIALYNILKSLNLTKIINQNFEPKSNKIKPFFSVFNTVRKLREQRMGMVSSYIQYKYIYEYALEHIKRNFELYTIEELN